MDSSAVASFLKPKELSAEGVAPTIAPAGRSKTTPSPASSDRVRNSYGAIRLGLVRGVVDYDADYDYEFLQDMYKKWVKEDEYLVLREEEELAGRNSRKWFAVKCSKRGNDVYVSRVKERLSGVSEALKPLVKCVKKRGIRKTNALYLTLSYDTKLKSRGEAWVNIGKEWNGFLSALRNEHFEEEKEKKEKSGKKKKSKKKKKKKKKPETVEVVRSWETYENGYPHIHAVIVWKDRDFVIWRQDKKKQSKKKQGKNKQPEKVKWRVRSEVRDRIAGKWHSFVDIQGVVDLKEAVKNVMWYVLKNRLKNRKNAYKYVDFWKKKELLTAVACWFFRKRSFSISGGFTDLIEAVCITKNKKAVQSTLEGKKAVKKYELIGIIAGSRAGIDSYVWCKTYLEPPEWLGEVHKIHFFSENSMKGWSDY